MVQVEMEELARRRGRHAEAGEEAVEVATVGRKGGVVEGCRFEKQAGRELSSDDAKPDSGGNEYNQGSRQDKKKKKVSTG